MTDNKDNTDNNTELTLEGQIERITFNNEENAYTVARVTVQGNINLVTVVGNIINPIPGQTISMKGSWTNHPQYGMQFQINRYDIKVPATVYGIQKYLGSGMIKGIGPKLAKLLVKKFGEKTLDMIETNPEKLIGINGIGKKRIKMIQQAWNEQREIRDVMVFLQGHGVSCGYATKIFKEYGKNSIEVVKTNPYRLAMDVYGIGFITADHIAKRLGFANDSPMRCEAGILYVLNQCSESGHVYYPYEELISQCKDILAVERDVLALSFASIEMSKKIVVEDLEKDFDDYQPNQKAVYLSMFYYCETQIALRLKMLMSVPHQVNIDTEESIDWVQKQFSIQLAPKQIEAIRCAVENKIMIITGGPGTGKTTIIKGILNIYRYHKVKTFLAAPTGRAAKRMSEATGYAAKTIHRLLEYSPAQKGFNRDDQNPLDCELLIIDESSMIDTILMHHLLKAVPLTSTLVLVGDVNQLPSVGAGCILNDLIGSNIIPVVTLSEIFRQAKESLIVVNAHLINNGEIPSLIPSSQSDDFYFLERVDCTMTTDLYNQVIVEIGQDSNSNKLSELVDRKFCSKKDFFQAVEQCVGKEFKEKYQRKISKYVKERDDAERTIQTILKVTTENIPNRFGFDPMEDIQILSPMQKGQLGAGNLNLILQDALNAEKTGINKGAISYRTGDKVMQIKNNYTKEVFNGDIGRIKLIDKDENEVTVVFDGREVIYDFNELDEIILAYAVSVHKSQGSEYPAVVIPIAMQHYKLLERNLIYTAVTRGKKLVVIIGNRMAFTIAIKNNKTQKRYTYLKQRLMLDEA